MVREGTAGTNDGDGLAQLINRKPHTFETPSLERLLTLCRSHQPI